MNENIAESFDKLIWHDSKLRFLRILRNGDVDEVLLDVELRGMPGQELVPMTVVLEDAVFFFSDIDLQGSGNVQMTFQAPSARPRWT
jgi:FixJ family two-component response regulator